MKVAELHRILAAYLESEKSCHSLGKTYSFVQFYDGVDLVMENITSSELRIVILEQRDIIKTKKKK